jgi:hypothetical protein
MNRFRFILNGFSLGGKWILQWIPQSFENPDNPIACFIPKVTIFSSFSWYPKAHQKVSAVNSSWWFRITKKTVSIKSLLALVAMPHLTAESETVSTPTWGPWVIHLIVCPELALTTWLRS